ncbi:epimerase [Aureimonas endophytica]|uniref:Epimerase n=1 Tax=Aureimonas endophytica TaxID=2027858 RepID=A0A917E951_9HYPH|nr:NAD(P)H-binding protein [Aureimonas endophytica]GGE15471.1 epimerase [Aureimonas endophytica]
MTKTILILGATGGVGGAVARVLLRRGWTVRALARDPVKAAAAWGAAPGPDWRRGDAMRRDDVSEAAAGASVILHGVNPPGYSDWDRLVLPMIDNTIAAARSAGGARILLPGTVYNYDPAALSLVDETAPQEPASRKGAIRVELERRLLAAAPDVPSLVVRAGDFFGPGVRQSWFAQSLAKTPLTRILNPGRPGIGHAWAYLPDLAEAMARLLELPSGHLQPAERVQFAGIWDGDGRQMAAAIRRAVNRPDLPERRFPWWLMRLLAPFGGFPREVMEVRPFWRHALAFDNRRLVELIGEEPRTPLETAVAEALAAA